MSISMYKAVSFIVIAVFWISMSLISATILLDRLAMDKPVETMIVFSLLASTLTASCILIGEKPRFYIGTVWIGITFVFMLMSVAGTIAYGLMWAVDNTVPIWMLGLITAMLTTASYRWSSE